MKVLFRERILSSVVSALVCMAIGIIFLVFPDSIISWTCRLIGGILLLFGVFYVLRFFADKTRLSYFQIDLLLGILLVVIGIWMLATPAVVLTFIQYIFGVLIVVHGIVDIQGSLHLWKKNVKNWYWSLALGGLTLLLGILVMANPFEAFETLVILIGCVLIYDGISDMFILFCFGSLLRREKKDRIMQEAAKDVVVEVEAEAEEEKEKEAYERDI